MRSNSSSVMSKNGVAELTPAPLTTMSTRPLRLRTCVQQALQLALLVALGGVEPGLAAGGADLGQAGVGLLLAAADQHDLGAGAGQPFGHRAAQLARAADDDRDLAAEAEELHSDSYPTGTTSTRANHETAPKSKAPGLGKNAVNGHSCAN